MNSTISSRFVICDNWTRPIQCSMTFLGGHNQDFQTKQNLLFYHNVEQADGTVLVSTQSETYGEFFVTHLLRYTIVSSCTYSCIYCRKKPKKVIGVKSSKSSVSPQKNAPWHPVCQCHTAQVLYRKCHKFTKNTYFLYWVLLEFKHIFKEGV